MAAGRLSGAQRTYVRTSDLHVITDQTSGAWLNPPADVVVQSHVRIGEDAAIRKGVRIGEGAIIGTRALVTRNVPPAALALGMPARVTRENVAWSRDRKPPSV